MADKSLEGFYLAVADMTTNLDAELARFKTRVKEEEVAKIENREGNTGSGSASLYLLIAALVVLLGRVADRKFRRGFPCRCDPREPNARMLSTERQARLFIAGCQRLASSTTHTAP